MDKIELQVIEKIKKARGGSVFFIDDFLSLGTAKTVSKVLERLVEKDQLTRVARGMYARLKTNPLFGKEHPSIEEIAKAIAKRDKARIVPTGTMALNILGLSTQIPLKIVYLTDGSARIVKLNKQTIKFKKASPRNLSAIGSISSLVIQALKEIGKDKVTEQETDVILKHLKDEEPYRLEHDIKLAPEWIRVIMRKALTPSSHA